MGLFKNPLVLGAIAAAVAWWFLRRRKADCHCDAPAVTTPATTAPPIATSPFATNAPVPEPATYSPPLPGPTLPTPMSASAQCTAAGGAYGWDPVKNAPFCAFPDAPAPARTPAATGDGGACARYGGVLMQDGGCQHCGTFGGTTMPDGSCCIPANGCNPNPPAAPPPVLTPAPVWSGYVNDPYGNRSGGSPAANNPRREACEGTNGTWGYAYYGPTGEKRYECNCPPGSYLNGEGFCVTGVI